MNSSLRFDLLPKVQLNAWHVLASESATLNRFGFYLAGGTALVLHLGHRRSVDFDFFSTRKRVGGRVQRWLEGMPGAVLRDVNPDTVHADLNGVKISLIGAYRYPTVGTFTVTDGLKLASVLDIALMKLLAITHRATLRDYLDLAVIIQDHIPLSALIRHSRTKYGSTFNPMIVLKALVSFEDVDDERPSLADQRLLRSWKTILLHAVKQTA